MHLVYPLDADCVVQVVDRVSILWMLDYLEAALAGEPYPPETNIYGTPWKVPHPRLKQVACLY